MLTRCLLLSTLSLCMCTGTGRPRVEKAEQLIEVVKEGARVEPGAEEKQAEEVHTCEGGGCSLECTGACQATCSGGGCNHVCAAGAICEFTCSGGGCNQGCAAGSNCELTCSGGGCNRTCADASCSRTCAGGGCNG